MNLYTSVEGTELSAERIVHPDGTDIIRAEVKGPGVFTILREDLVELGERFRSVKDDPTPEAIAFSVGSLITDIQKHVSAPYETVFDLARGLVMAGWMRDTNG